MTRFKGKKVLLLGSGGLRIGQAGEFDYSGAQALKALKEAQIHSVLVNPNIATVQTDAGLADEVYFVPLALDALTEIIEKERPEGILLGFGGQTALNLGVELFEKGILARYGVEVLGTSVEAILKTEDRALFKELLDKAGLKTPYSHTVYSVEEAERVADQLGYPLMLRAGFSLGGLGSGRVANRAELIDRASKALSHAPQILLEEALFGWKEFEYEIVRDHSGNALTICSLENMDPMGVHTGESIVVAPAQTLSNQEFFLLRDVALKSAALFDIVGECNIQYAVNPANGDYRIIEMNARLSRSSALASKATGYPLAFVAAKIALGYSLPLIKFSAQQQISAFFEPALDYIVVKIPRWDMQKLPLASRSIGTEMKSVGEVMAIGRSFPEALQKATRMLNIGALGVTHHVRRSEVPILDPPTDERIFALGAFFANPDHSVEEAHRLTKIDPWFLRHIEAIALLDKRIQSEELSVELLKLAKQNGFCDALIGLRKNMSEEAVRALRISHQILPVVKKIDSVGGEREVSANYLYLTYHGTFHDITCSEIPSVVILGSGVYCIGSSVEFDWCAVNCAKTLRHLGMPTILINYNPETVSTDYDETDRLYFEELSLERVRDILDFELIKGIIVSVGGQVANNLALPLHRAGYSFLGTCAESIDQAENRARFSQLLNELEVLQPAWKSVTTLESIQEFIAIYGYPVLLRPSYVLSGTAMRVVYSELELRSFFADLMARGATFPVVVSQFITEGKELEVDGVANKGEVLLEAVSEHIEHAGVHSGDATIVFPAQDLTMETLRKAKKITAKIVKALRITGAFNLQLIAKNNTLQVIECNVRASRSFPFVSKVSNHNFIASMTKVLMGMQIEPFGSLNELDHVGVKAPIFSYQRLKGSDPVAHVEMASTGEVACIGADLPEAFFAAWQATEQRVNGRSILVSIGGPQKEKFLPWLQRLDQLGWILYATEGTHDFLSCHGLASHCVFKIKDCCQPDLLHLIELQKIDLIINIPNNKNTALTQTDGLAIRRAAVDHRIPLVTNISVAILLLRCLADPPLRKGLVKSWKDYCPSLTSQGIV